MEVKFLCKECHYAKEGKHKDGWLWCDENERWVDLDDYCSWGLSEEEWLADEVYIYPSEEPEVPDKWVVNMEMERRMERG